MKTRADPKQRRPGSPSGSGAGAGFAARAGAGAEERARRAARALRRHALQDLESNRQVDEFLLQRSAGASG